MINLENQWGMPKLFKHKLFFDLIFVIDLARVLAGTDSCSAAVPNPVLRADSLCIAMWS
jgi:low temperature requirement protein LtrA